jgi:hypothetical protein
MSTASRQLKGVDPRILLATSANSDNSTETLKLAITHYKAEIFELLWEDYPDLYTVKGHLREVFRWVFRYAEKFGGEAGIKKLMLSEKSTAAALYMNTCESEHFVECRNSLLREDRFEVFSNRPYDGTFERYGWIDLEEEVVDRIFDLIKDNEVDHLKQILDQRSPVGVAFLRWDSSDQIEAAAEPTFVFDDWKISHFNPLLVAILTKSLACVKYLVERH